MASPAPGLQIGPYELESRIGAGGMGEVWRARDRRLNRAVAIKFAQERFSERSIREARAIAALNHPNIAVLYDVGPDYLVMEYVDGRPLRPFDDLQRTLDVAAQAASGLAAAHAHGIIHRDLKPDNILFTRVGAVKIIDFGIAKQSIPGLDDSTVSADLTRPGTMLGTTAYMSPEQARGEEAEAASDQFSLGLILFELLARARAFERPTAAETLAAIIREPPAPLPPCVPPPLRWTIERCLEKDPKQRYESTEDLHRELKKLRERVGELAAVAEMKPTRRPQSALRVRVLASACLVAGTALFAMVARVGDLNANLKFSPISVEAGADRYPAFSPDGRSIAYSQDVDGVAQVFVRVIPGGTPVQLTQEPFASNVRFWSHDGRRIFFLRGVRLFAVSAAGGKPQMILENAVEPIETPDGKSILFGTDVGPHPKVFVSSPPGAPPKMLTSVPVESANNLAQQKLSPDGNQLFLPALEGPSLVLDLSKGAVRRLATVTDIHSADWLPDSRHVVVITRSPSRLSLVDTTTEQRHTLLSTTQALSFPAVSPNGTRIAFGSGGNESDLLDMSTDGRSARPLLQTPLPERAVDWAPDGQSFVYESAPYGIWIRDGSGRHPRRVTDDPSAFSPAFSPDGRRVAYLTPGKIVVATIDGGVAVRLNASTAAGALCWSPDGEGLAYTTGPTRGGQLLKVAANGSADPVKIASNATNFPTVPCAWTPDGRSIVYRGDDGIRLVSQDGRDDRLIVSAPPLRVSRPMFYRVSRSGELIVVQSAGTTVTTGLTRYDLRTGASLVATTLDTGGALVRDFAVHPDGKRLAISIFENRSDLWMVENFPVPASGWRKLFGHWMRPRVAE